MPSQFNNSPFTLQAFLSYMSILYNLTRRDERERRRIFIVEEQNCHYLDKKIITNVFDKIKSRNTS